MPSLPPAAARGLALAAGVTLLAGCGAAAPSRVLTLPARHARLTDRPPIARPRSHHGGPVAHVPVGAAQPVRSGGAALTVTVRTVIDPLVGSGASLQPGTRAVGVEVAIRNAGPAVYDSSATGDISLAVTRGSVSPVFASAGVCETPDQDFDSYITAGEDRMGCVAFAVPAHSRVLAVRFSPHAQDADRLSWRVGG